MSSRSATAPSLSSAGSVAPAGAIDPAGFSPVKLSAKGLHELAVQAFRTGNRGRLSLCEALRVLDETRLFIDLGFPGLVAYADAYFQLRRSETFEHVRVAKAMMRLAQLREAFGQGRIGWSVLKAISRDALRSRRDTPRDSSYGLPNLDQKLVLRFSSKSPIVPPGTGVGTGMASPTGPRSRISSARIAGRPGWQLVTGSSRSLRMRWSASRAARSRW